MESRIFERFERSFDLFRKMLRFGLFDFLALQNWLNEDGIIHILMLVRRYSYKNGEKMGSVQRAVDESN